jgi:hypothetical protein
MILNFVSSELVLNFNFSEFNESVGRMTHWDCEPSWNFVPQEFALPETLTTLRKMVIEKNQKMTK